jgi:short-subunit dehydrogenase
MREQGGGSIINISSGTALMHLPNMAAYSSIKRALADLSLTAREELKKDHISVSVVYPYMTLTNFEENTIKDFVGEENPTSAPSFQPPPPDTAEFIAQKIVDCVRSEAAEVFAHDWMKK